MKLEGRVAIVTGGAGFLGNAVCRRLANDGAHVVVADINLDQAKALATDIGPNASAAHLDAGETESVRSLIESVVETHGKLDILHNNAATLMPGTGLDNTVIDTEFDTWDRAYSVNLRGYIAACRYAIPHMISAGGGVIVNTSSGAAFLGDSAGAAYGCMKAAIVSLTQHVATAFGKQMVRCVGISPGAMMTAEKAEFLVNEMPGGEEILRILERHHLTPYLGAPEDFANLVAFVASDEARFITGVTLKCDGGVLAHMPTLADLRPPNA